MAYTVEHILINTIGKTSIRRSDDGVATAHFSSSGSMHIGFPGSLNIKKLARYAVRNQVEDDPRGRPSRRPRWEGRTFPLTLEIRTPDGNLFTAQQVTLDDLRRFRDLRGVSAGVWTYKVSGAGPPVAVDDGELEIKAGDAHLGIALIETIASKSAIPLVDASLDANAAGDFKFDLWRVGTFTANARLNVNVASRGRTMKLRDPEGAIVAESTTGRLTYPVTLRTLDKSRDTAGRVRSWRLEVLRPTSAVGGGRVSVWASVIETAGIGTAALMSRIEDVIGKRGSKLKIYAEAKDGHVLARLVILDEFTAALIERYKLLKGVLKESDQDDGVSVSDIVVGTKYTLYRTPEEFGNGFKLWVFGMKIGAIDIAVGESVRIQPPVPALKISVEVEGSAKIEYKGIGLANGQVRDNRIEVEVGLRLAPDGIVSATSWVDGDRLDVDVAGDLIQSAVAAGLVLGGGVLPTAVAVGEEIETKLNNLIVEGLRSIVDGAGSQIPHILAMVLGDHFTFRSQRVEGEAVLFEYAAPLEADPHPADPERFRYRGIVGRSATQFGHDVWQIIPPTVANTWAAENLNKVEHIVVVMMENRSFDHVLGYIAAEGDHSSDGLSKDLTDFLKLQGFPVPKLSASGIPPNGVGRKTRFPAHVGHHRTDVIQQLSERIALDSGRQVNSPLGFRENFKDRIPPSASDEITVDHVLGYHDAFDLPFFKFLTDHYARCERFFSSHAGPTLPNRMFSLTGDLQYDRSGEAIVENNKGENVALSRAVSIFDVLTRKGVEWRVYESYPSVSMLRMFARYATNTKNIVDIRRLEEDVVRGDLPSVTFIDPAMHHDPQNDDHPVADMYRGQVFLQDVVYKALRANEGLWSKTLLIITYDEHGGFYDHVIPPIAEVRTRTLQPNDGGPAGAGHFTPDTVITSYGVRVPTFVVSPWVPAGKGPDIVLDFCSILKTILARFCGDSRPFLSDRVLASRSFEAYLTEATARLTVPTPEALPPLLGPIRGGPVIITEPVFDRQMRGENVDFHDLTGMLARMLGRGSENPIA